MSYLQKQMNSLKYDKRLLEINLKAGNITQEEYDKYVEDQKDDSGNAIKLDLAAEADNHQKENMNGGKHPAGSNQDQTASMPANNDPFGSGF